MLPATDAPPSPGHNLPVQPTALLGRGRERDAVQQQLLLDDVRLLTLHGPGGVGKTRLALAVCPELKLLVTNREPLHLRWERTFAVSPLSVPDLHDRPAPERLAEVPSVALFVERARSADAGFAPTPTLTRTPPLASRATMPSCRRTSSRSTWTV